MTFDAAQADLFASGMSEARMDALIIEAAKRAQYYVIEAGTETRYHGGISIQEHTAIKIGMGQFIPRELRSLFQNFLALALTEPCPPMKDK